MTITKTKNRVKIAIIAFIVCLIIGYSYLKMRDVLTGPIVTLLYPPNGSSLNSPLVDIKGKAENITQLYLNGRKIFTDEQGNFSEPVLVAKGYNLFEVKAQDKFGHKSIKKLELVLN